MRYEIATSHTLLAIGRVFEEGWRGEGGGRPRQRHFESPSGLPVVLAAS